jgi:hypothetical protein
MASADRALVRGPIDHLGFEATAQAELGPPLVAQRERRQDEDAIGGAARCKLAKQQTGFDRLSLTDGVGQEQARVGSTDDSQRRR